MTTTTDMPTTTITATVTPTSKATAMATDDATTTTTITATAMATARTMAKHKIKKYYNFWHMAQSLAKILTSDGSLSMFSLKQTSQVQNPFFHFLDFTF